MIKKCALLLILFPFLFITTTAQILNNQFENWTVAAYDSLNYWSTDNFLNSSCAQKEISIVQSGTASLRLTSSPYTYIAPLSLPGIASTGGFSVTGATINLAAGGQPDAVRHAFLKGYYQYTSVGGAQGSIEVVLYKNNGGTRDTIASGIMAVSAASSYTLFSVPLNYHSAGSPDSSIIYFQSSSRALSDLFNTGTLGSTLYIDSIYFEGTVGIQETSTNLTSLTAFPNPASDFLTIQATWETPVKSTVSIFDASGKLIQNVPMLNEKQRIDIRQFGNGSYFYHLIGEHGEPLGSGEFMVRR